MKFYKTYKPYIIYIIAVTGFIAGFALLKENSIFINAIKFVSSAFHKLSTAFCSLFSFSMAEVMYTAVFIFAALAIAVTAIKLIKYRKKRLSSLVKCALSLCCASLTIWGGLSLFWGHNYYTTSFEEKSGLQSMPVSAAELYETTKFFVQKLHETALGPKRNASLVCIETAADALNKSEILYRNLEKEYPFLKGLEHRAKPMAYSRFFSVLGFTGYFFPFTGESNINIDYPPALIPSTIAHEIAHVRGIAPEQTANFIAVRACEVSKDVFYEYSGWLLGYIHLSNALYQADREAYFELFEKLPEQVLADLRADSAYWQQFESPVQKAADKAYSGFLQGYDQELGSKSYGACVDLLCAYYGKMSD